MICGPGDPCSFPAGHSWSSCLEFPLSEQQAPVPGWQPPLGSACLSNVQSPVRASPPESWQWALAFFFILVQAGPVPKCQESSISSQHTVRAQILVDMCWGIRWTMPVKWDQQGKLGTMPEAIQGIIWKMPKECKLFTEHLNPSVLYSSPSSYERV